MNNNIEINNSIPPAPSRKIRLGLDIHGVIDSDKPFFAALSKLLIDNGHEVHIMTGPSLSKIENELEGIHSTTLFSIADHCKQTGITMVYDEKGDPWCDQYEWNRAKGDYARKHKLDLVIDDSKDYPNFFSTPIATYQSRKEWLSHDEHYKK